MVMLLHSFLSTTKARAAVAFVDVVAVAFVDVVAVSFVFTFVAAVVVVAVVAFKNQLNIFVAMEKGEEMTRKLFFCKFFFAKCWFEMRWADQK